VLKHPRTTRMPSLAVYGDSGMGKSMLVEPQLEPEGSDSEGSSRTEELN